jgi:uncharacterized protein YxjI
MQYKIRQKIFSLGDKFTIKDENDRDVFIVKSQILSFGKKLRIFDLYENEMCYIEQQLFKFMPQYNIYINGEMVANIKKKFSLFKNDFEILSDNANYYVEGEFLAHEFRIFNDRKLIGQVSKKFLSLADTYSVEVDDDEDQVVVLALAIVIDMVCHDNDK